MKKLIGQVTSLLVAIFFVTLINSSCFAQQVAIVNHQNEDDTFRLAYQQIGSGKWKDAVVNLRKLVELSPNTEQYNVCLGLALGGQATTPMSDNPKADNKEAAQYLKKGIELNPSLEKNYKYLWTLASCLSRSDQDQEALKYINKGIELAPEDSMEGKHLRGLKKALGG